MKRLLTISTLFFLCFTVRSQSMDAFLREKGCELIASLAHPSNTLANCNYKINENTIWIDVNYQEGYNTKVIIKRSGGFFTNIEIVSDSDWFPAFWVTEKVKDLVVKWLSENQDAREQVSDFEKRLGKYFAEMNALEMSALLLTLEWLKY